MHESTTKVAPCLTTQAMVHTHEQRASDPLHGKLMSLEGQLKMRVLQQCCSQAVSDRFKPLQVSMDRIKVVQLNEPFIVEGVKVTFIDANHCPGSAMVLFQVLGRRPVLHTGDCRHVYRNLF